jgi:hypothetical protein
LCFTTMHRCAALRLDAVRCSHCTDRLLFVRAADDCSSTASIDGSVGLERVSPRKRAGAEQRASAFGGLIAAVVARALCMAGGCSPRARVAPHTGAVVQTFVRLSQEGGSMVRDVARSAFRAHGDVLHATCSCTPYTVCDREITGDCTSCARHDAPTSAVPRRPCDVLWVC